MGVGHQYFGNVGKTSNSQVAVFGCLSNGKYGSLVDCRLYLPKSWTTDISRCDEAGIPVDERIFKTKQELAINIVKHQLSIGITFDYIAADGLYGNDAFFALEINNMGLIYMLDVHSDQPKYLQKPELFLSERKTAKGSSLKKLKATTEHINVCKYINTLKTSDWKTIEIRNSAKGVLKGKFHFKSSLHVGQKYQYRRR